MNINLAPFVQNLRELVAAPPFTSNPLLMFSTESKPNRMRRETSSEATRSTPLLLPARGSDYVIYKYTLAVGSLASIPFPLLSSLLLAYRTPFGHKLSANLSLMSYFRTLYQDLHHPVEASVYLFLSSMHNWDSNWCGEDTFASRWMRSANGRMPDARFPPFMSSVIRPDLSGINWHLNEMRVKKKTAARPRLQTALPYAS